MKRIEVSDEAGRDLQEIVRFSRKTFGPDAVRRYRALIRAAYIDLALDGSRAGVVPGPGSLRLYHLRHSRKRGAVQTPRHLVVFEDQPEAVRIVRLLHDAMDLPARLSDV